MSDVTSDTPLIDDDAAQDEAAIPMASFIPDDIKKPVQSATKKLTDAADGVDGVAEHLEKAMDYGLDKVEKKLDGFINGLDKLLGKL